MAYGKDTYSNILEEYDEKRQLAERKAEAFNNALCTRSPEYAAMVEEIRKELKFTSLKYTRLDDLISSTGLPASKLCTYCWTGKE